MIIVHKTFGFIFFVLNHLVWEKCRPKGCDFFYIFSPPEGQENFPGGIAKSKKKTLLATMFEIELWVRGLGWCMVTQKKSLGWVSAFMRCGKFSLS